MDLVVCVWLSAYVTMHMVSLRITYELKPRLPPSVPLVRWTVLGLHESFLSIVKMHVLALFFSPVIVLYYATQKSIQEQRALLCAVAAVRGYVEWDAAFEAWRSFGDPTEIWADAVEHAEKVYGRRKP